MVAIMVLGLIVIIGLVVLSPVALTELAHLRSNWLQLSEIGQTYGAVSALLTSLALVGVIFSLLYQSRNNQNAREQTIRSLQFELIRLAMGDPALMTAAGAPWDLDIPADSSSIRQFLYVQVWVSFLSGNYMIGELPESSVRHLAAHEIFRSQAGRNYWKAVGQVQISNSKGPRKRFFRILDDEYNKAISSGVPVARSIKVTEPSTGRAKSRAQAGRQLSKFVAATIIGIIAGRLWQHRKEGT
jgi:uncharacterized membrane protein